MSSTILREGLDKSRWNNMYYNFKERRMRVGRWGRLDTHGEIGGWPYLSFFSLTGEADGTGWGGAIGPRRSEWIANMWVSFSTYA